MPFSQKAFDRAIWEAVAGIRPGDVRSYGEVARAAGYPRHARLVSQAMRRPASPLPWYRVVRSDRTLAFEPGSRLYKDQKTLLEKEGVVLAGGKVVLPEPFEPVDLDRLLWGPSDP